MLMYGRENNAVVHATNAVNATRNTLKGSTKNCSAMASCGPSAITRAVSAQLARKVPRLAATFASAAQRRSPNSASTAAPNSGSPRHSTSSIALILAQRFQVMQVEAVELLPDLEEEDAEDEHADQNVQRDAELDHHRHAER